MTTTPQSMKPMHHGLTFTIRQEPDFDTDQPVEFGCFSRNWDDEEALDQLIDDQDAARFSNLFQYGFTGRIPSTPK